VYETSFGEFLEVDTFRARGNVALACLVWPGGREKEQLTRAAGEKIEEARVILERNVLCDFEGGDQVEAWVLCFVRALCVFVCVCVCAIVCLSV
jgi:hypothetical protein